MNQQCIGVDFGTTNCAISWINPKSGMPEIIRNQQGDEKTPSVVYVGSGGVLVGRPALEQLTDAVHMGLDEQADVLSRTFLSVKCLLRDNFPHALPDGVLVTPVKLAAEILAHLREGAERGCFSGQCVRAAVISHPVALGKKAIANLQEAAAIEGFKKSSMKKRSSSL